MWDYIVVGAGTAGCVLAHELTASGRNKVLLVEAGGKPPLAARMPAGFSKLFKSEQDWAFDSEPQEACGGRIVYTPRGKMLGGSANINAQIHQWCHPADFDGWAARGASGWAWDDVRPTFRSMECWTGGEEGGQERGRLGPMAVGGAPPNPLSEAFVAAARAAGLDGPEDYNGCAYSGAWLSQQAHKAGCRFSVYDAYLKPAMKRPNLAVMTEAQVGKILIEEGRATGIELAGRPESPQFASLGVVLAAGAFGSPQILMLSGLGPADHLYANGIEPVRDLPGVGADLQDHPSVPVRFETRRPITLKSAASIGQLLRWLVLRTGALTSNVAEAIAFTGVLDRDAPDLELIFGVVDWQDQGLSPPARHAYTIVPVALTPRSRGTVRLKTASTSDPPAIDFGLLTDREGADARVLVEGVRLARRIAATDPLHGETLGECAESAGRDSDEALRDYFDREIQNMYHPCGTCRMGEDEGAVVDSRLRLQGIEALWVADASVMPTVPRGHPNAVVAMIAKRAAGSIESGSLPV